MSSIHATVAVCGAQEIRESRTSERTRIHNLLFLIVIGKMFVKAGKGIKLRREIALQGSSPQFRLLKFAF
jgi:hypothetical protein